MKNVISTQYFGPIAYFCLLANGHDFLIERHEHYQKRSIRNRCNFLSANGAKQISVPLKKGKHEGLSIDKVKIAYEEDWIKKHLTTLSSAYGKSAFYEHYISKIEDVLKSEYLYLFDLNNALEKLIRSFLHIDTDLNFTLSYSPKGYDKDLRNKEEWEKLNLNWQRYPQVFEDKFGFQKDLSVLDLVFNLGPEAATYLKRLI